MPQFGEIVLIEDTGPQSDTTGIWLSSTPELVLKDTGEIIIPSVPVSGMGTAAPFEDLGKTIAQQLSRELESVDTRSISEMGKQVADWIKNNINSAYDSLKDVILAALKDISPEYDILMSVDLLSLAQEIAIEILQLL
jgi:hypothetical protein